MGSPETGPSPDSTKFNAEINERATKASTKVREKVQKIIAKAGFEEDLLDMQNDFYSLAEDPNDECGGGSYKDWTPDEIRELYRVLYGKEMDS